MTMFELPTYTATAGELFDAGEFFAPAPFDLFDTLLGQYESARRRLQAMADAVSGDACDSVLHYFVKANTPESRYSMPSTVGELFNLDRATAYLDADFWQRTLNMTDILQIMPQKRKDEWFTQIGEPLGNGPRPRPGVAAIERIPEFTADNVRASLESLFAMRGQFFAERVDGIFRALSRKHVTNQPEGFSKRAILRVLNEWGTEDYSACGVINDLRAVVAKFMGREEPSHGSSSALIQAVRRRQGEWQDVDGGAFRIRIYNGVGTAHIEVNEAMAWRLNTVLHSIYPQAIPSRFREPPKKARKTTSAPLFSKPLPFAVLDLLARMKPGVEPSNDERWNAPKFRDIPHTLRFERSSCSADAARKQAAEVLASIGGVFERGAGHLAHWRFDYEPSEIIDAIVCSGMVPDQVSHQFYPTPARVAALAIAEAEEGATDSMRWLEPSAGNGALADLMPRGTKCIEVTELRASILKAKGHEVECLDFLTMASAVGFDRVVMNPPFSGNRWQAHTEHAATMIAPGGRLVAILPASASNRFTLPGFSCRWSAVLSNEFDGTGVSVVILTADRSS
ncbi:DUF4942 domain-containing protein [Xanthomonas euvesicatoria]|uniref:DUF4942 domain-containing protein n=1 Tax=Xanthomonas euvesicatoria TaxID=456327 RepID=UPI001C494C21|nr:DUF4942 domain-containing protein [Xanthomonas euvesicatoria]MBV6867892.1 DUF4942 domain-containing protein [Xanthomonas campestris pv. coriandri]MCE4330812.1 DUF4942 domain-containing protein [Xanthomonas campestris pv. coriandri]